mmetsp:Transcript_7691/g.13288  ORF Transcript_7691/g.13288 Transcript_7691/m.13288 type:complete len:269 (-) Transcript_7691:709-1515(-)|eukprot:CAMPEP_0119116036 /NCGR_PEP_ID=MMETSP1180-20130426/52064_1 /TAXON_ID=3052 ORGANISM="Chlamydomonas cf sp, Strain CCMP681" /NCGR_SAMPLE_ID=MMETSP1180 /ASSEMBLY_ACC=CAM_ASM_000741 /LENGTH=268 /DNA_ID=CAMNT_0007105151 /DNA_START=7 /DNA_END=813 /DNA_ORIENTATION=+
MAALKDAQALLVRFKGACNSGDVNGAEALLSQLKLKLIELPSLPPMSQPSPTSQQELLLARDAYEHAALLAIKQQSEAGMERAFAQLHAFYADTASQLPPSSQEQPLLGLNLLRLLVANRIAEFHTELELMAPAAHAHPYVAGAIQLERWLMEGTYNKVMDASKNCPSDLHVVLMAQLANTVREETASCMARAYLHLKLPAAQRMLMLDSPQATIEFAKEHAWHVTDDVISFSSEHQLGAEGAKPKGIPPMDLIQNALVYAKELERIV